MIKLKKRMNRPAASESEEEKGIFGGFI